MRPDLIITDLRGNIDTRIRKLKEEDLDAIIMAKAAIARLNLENVRFTTFTTMDMIPAVGQGAIGIQIRKEDKDIFDMLKTMNHDNTFHAVSAERAVLSTLDSGCQFPVGSYAQVTNNKLVIKGFVASEDGKDILIDELESEVEHAENTGRLLGEKLLDKGAQSLLDFFKNH
jgi:hydroxymethylbilane synthase